MRPVTRTWFFVLASAIVAVVRPSAVRAVGQTRYVDFVSRQGSFQLAQGDELATLYVDALDT
jgi:hypothetical protein